ncbi:hypothetical protein L1887_11509 [Cichorium endivia]|nr:hypothetical protein L1887_11509 [Cichorium endivia]
MLTIVNDDSFSRSRFLLQFDWSFLLQFDWTVTEITDLLYPIGATTIAAAHCRHHRRSSTSPAPPPSQQHFTVQQPPAIPRRLQLKSTELLSFSRSRLELVTLTFDFRS